jgi:adenylate cyclase
MRGSTYRPSLTQLSLVAFGVVALVVGALFYGLLDSARRAVLARAEELRESAAAQIDARTTRDLGEAAAVVDDLDQSIRAEAIDTHSPESAEGALFALLLDHPHVSDITLTHPDRWQIAVSRASADPASGITTRIVRPDGGRFVAEVKTRVAGAKLHDGAVTHEDATDPTAHPTYATTVSPEIYGTPIWSDLHYSELDHALAAEQRRIVVTVQKAVDDASGHPAGVVRVGLLATTVDDIAKTRVDEASGDDPYRVFLCDAEGRLLTRLSPDDRRALSGDDLRVTPANLPPQVAHALASPALREVSMDRPVTSESFVLAGRRFLLTFRALSATEGWIVGIVVAEDHYTRDLRALRDRFVAVDAVGAACALLGGGLVVASVRGGFRRLLATTSRMRDFDFAPDARVAWLREVGEVSAELERAKTAMRALGKYVPVDLVRELYATNREPVLGGELARLTLMFTDIRGFTDLSERLSPNELAQALGHYLDAMTGAIRATGGTIDKFIGDAVMSIWNAPTPRADHPKLACRAALACTEATARLFASDAWRGLPALVTRYGIHTDDVLVGNFGAPARFSYTALGDGVNLASRLESLCKQYGVTRLVSDAVQREACDEFSFRKLDRVAVKGKANAVLVFELLGPVGSPRSDAVRAYESALERYFERRFDEAIAELSPHAATDGPSQVLLDRCRAFVASPPPPDWDGAWVAQSK